MNDLMLVARLKDLGMPEDQANSTAALIRDKLHPVAAVAASKILAKIRKPTLPAAGTRETMGLGGNATTALTYASLGTKVAGVGIAVASAASLAATGAAFGSVVPVLGTAIGAVVGLVAGLMIHQGQGPQRAAMAQALDKALATVPTSFVGRTLPWSDARGGLEQFISALMTSGLYMSWDPSLLTNPSVNGNWSLTFTNAVRALVAAMVKAPVGATVSVPIVLSTGASGIGPLNFSFVNPGVNIGPDAISANLIMGQGGLMYQMITHIGETAAHAQANAYNAGAQKVFALMADKATADNIPNSLSTTLANAPIVQVPAPVALAAAPIAASAIAAGAVPTLAGGSGVATITTPTTVGTQYLTPSPVGTQLPVTAALTPQQDATAALMQQMLAAQGANFSSPAATQVLADVAANGVEATPNGPGVMPDWLLPAGIAAAVVLGVFLLKGKGSAAASV